MESNKKIEELKAELKNEKSGDLNGFRESE